FIERTFWGDGWTGYTWDPELFPDYKGFLNWLKTNGLSTILNLHPARGVRWFESQYSDMAKAVGIDPSTKESVKLSLSNPKFVNAYFKYLHRPYENAGVDHWWVDWQQGRKSEQKHLDPLWALNHFHSLEANTNNRRPLILSRYAGPGSHRYPIGFSGDAMSSWRCLRFQPYFTATAANIGYTWWSHDIGGFWGGIKNDELYLRWLQFGVYSPINRLHSTRNELMGKEVWNYRPDVQHYARRLLIKRHKLIPYTYTMNWRTHKEGLPICQPLYHKYPEYAESYQYKNQYFFGSELLACPITKKSSGKMALSTVKVWLPKGRWTDINTDRVYQGNRELVLTREIHEIPVFAKEGAIIPFAAEEEMFNTGLPKALNIHIYRGNNKFSLYEDSGNDATHIDGNYALTDISIADDGSNNAVVKIEAAKGDGAALLPKKRKIGITLKDISTAKNVSILLNGKTVKPLIESNPLRVTLLDIKPTDSIEMTISSYKERGNLQFGDEVVRLFSRLGISNIRKSIKYSRIKNLINDKKRFAKTVKKMRLPKVLKGALSELILMEN
ncbi:MAG: DUF5110 domain-containing protein, partial [Firmicutes bacterium]|nr:DUF5110 domain-containing protein [Bacillota bacterium]